MSQHFRELVLYMRPLRQVFCRLPAELSAKIVVLSDVQRPGVIILALCGLLERAAHCIKRSGTIRLQSICPALTRPASLFLADEADHDDPLRPTVATPAKAPVQLLKKAPLQCGPPRLTAETVIGALEDAEDYKALEAAIIADYDVQSAVERELALRLASLLWRLRRATTMETGLFEIQADYVHEFRHARHVDPASREVVHALFAPAEPVSFNSASHSITNGTETVGNSGPKSIEPAVDHTADLARCFLRLANLPNFALDRLSRYEATLWRQVGQILFALDALDRRKPQGEGDVSTRSRRRAPGI